MVGITRIPARLHALWTDERGMVTVEAAYAIAAIITSVLIGVAAIGAAAVQIRCTDAAREAARLTAIGDQSAHNVAARVAGKSARITIDTAGQQVTVEVRSKVPLLPLEMSAHAVAAKEPDGNSGAGQVDDGLPDASP